MDVLYNRIFELIGEEHGSIKNLAKAIGVSGNLISNWKAGVSKSYPKYAPQIADYFGVSLDWLSGLTDDKTKKTPSEDEVEDERIIKLRAKLSDMSGEQLDKLIAMMDLMGI